MNKYKSKSDMKIFLEVLGVFFLGVIIIIGTLVLAVVILNGIGYVGAG